MPSDDDILMGFDARELWYYDFIDNWQNGGSFIWSLRSDILKPLSIDNGIWGSLFDQQDPTGYPGIPRPSEDERQFPFAMWLRLSDVDRVLAQSAAILVQPYCVIAISWPKRNTLTTSEEFRRYNINFYPTEPARCQPSWKLLGYDVAGAEYGCTVSAVSNNWPSQGYGREPEFRDRWGKCLNKLHLFDDAGQALEFARLSDVRVREHRPFAVFGIWLVRAVGSWGMGGR